MSEIESRRIKYATMPLHQLYRMLHASFERLENASTGVLSSLSAMRKITYIWTELENRHVYEARRQGYSWEMVAKHVDVSRQAAQQRWSRPVDTTPQEESEFDDRPRDAFSGKPRE